MAVELDAGSAERLDRWSPVQELRESLFLLVLTASSLSAYIGLGVVAVRLFAAR